MVFKTILYFAGTNGREVIFIFFALGLAALSAFFCFNSHTPTNEPRQKTDGREGRGTITERKPAGCSGVKSALGFG